ncbi:MAG: cell division protein FtsQ/DivIB [Candidatus Dojkabacteria bacterium]
MRGLFARLRRRIKAKTNKEKPVKLTTLSQTRDFMRERQLKLAAPKGSNDRALAVANINNKATMARKSEPKKLEPARKARGKRAQIAAQRIAFVLSLLFLAGAFVFYTYRTEAWKVQEVEINGELKVLQPRAAELEQELIGLNLITLNTGQFVEVLREDPYVEQVYMRKEFPGRIVVSITEAKPYVQLVSLNGLHLYEDDGELLAGQLLDDNIPLSEVERLMYLNPNVFKSEMLRDLWRAGEQENLEQGYTALVSDLEERRELEFRVQSLDSGLEQAGLVSEDLERYQQEVEQLEDLLESQWREEESYDLQDAIKYILITGQVPERQRIDDSEESLRNIETGLQPLYFNRNFETADQIAREYYVDMTFRALPTQRLEGIYSREREQVQVTVAERFAKIEEELVKEGESTPIRIYSLLTRSEIQNFEELIASGYFDTLISEVSSERFEGLGYVSSRAYFVNPTTLSLVVSDQQEGAESQNYKTLVFSTRKDLVEELLRLETVLLKLQVEEKEYNRINLTGEKIVVS